jgi:hypothetical protein
MIARNIASVLGGVLLGILFAVYALCMAPAVMLAILWQRMRVAK